MSTNFKVQLQYIPQTVVIFGCGGTGSRIIPAVAQLMSTLQTLVNPELILCDFDIVEEKNLSRQNFARPDVGKNKAEALAGRYSKAYNLKVTPITVAAGTKEYAEALNMFGVADRLRGPTLYIIAVDSVKARQEILANALLLQSGSAVSSVVIDCGNEDIFGQVSYFTTAPISAEAGRDLEFINNWYQGVIPGEHVLHELPVDVLYYSQMREGESTRSCADLDQTLAINNLMAAQAIAIAQNVLMGKPMNYWRVNFDLFNGVSYDTVSVSELVKRAASRHVRTGTSSADRTFSDKLDRMYSTASGGISAQIIEMCAGLEDEMLSDTPTRYETSKMIRESLGLPKFVPGTLFAGNYADYYTEEYKTLWNTGYNLPKPSEEDVRTYELCQNILKEMQDECDRLNAQEAQQATERAR